MRKIVFSVMLALILISILTMAFKIQPIKATAGTIYIKTDGSVDPPTAPIRRDGNLYTFTAEIYNSIVVERDNIVIDGAGYTLQGTGSGIGISLSGRTNVTVRNTQIKNFSYGVLLEYSSFNNSISGNNITANNGDGIYLYGSYNNSISGNNIANNGYGIVPDASSNNIISGNNIANNSEDGVYFEYSCYNNIISGNNIANNRHGVRFGDYCSNNLFYHNNFIDNSVQVYSTWSINVWDDGYPSGGNYWSDYKGVDYYSGPYQNITGSDGIGDTSHDLNGGNDRYPLMAPFKAFDAGVWNGKTCSVDIISNSTVSDFKLNATQKTLSFNVTGIEEDAGFSRISIPNVIVQDLWQDHFTVLLNGELWPFRNWTDHENTYIYINYTYLEHQIIIIPEFPSSLILPLLMAFTMLVVVFMKKKNSKTIKI